MSYTMPDQNLDEVRDELNPLLTKYRERVENRLRDRTEWSDYHRTRLKTILELTYKFQIEINDI